MSHDRSREARPSSFCGACGAALPTDARFCPSCGDAAAAAAAETAAAPVARSGRMAAVLVFCLFVAGGAGAAWWSLSGATPDRAVPGRPTPGAAAAGATAAANGNVPPGHPDIELPQEVVGFLDELTAKAEAAPEDLEAWQNLARARYRAALLNDTYTASAVKALDHVVELDPDNLEAMRTYGNIAYDGRRFEEAEKHFRRYLELDPDDPGVRTDLGSTLLFGGKADEAKTLYEAVIESDPEFPQAYVNLGIALHSEGRSDEAMKLFKKARGLTDEPAQVKRIDQIIAAAEGKPPPGHPPTGAAAKATAVSSNAKGEFQTKVDALFTGHRIVGPRISSIRWEDSATASVILEGFPMDKMPPVMRNKFKSTLNEKIAALADAGSVNIDDVDIALVDAGSKAVMDRLDGKELVGAFDEESYE